MMDPGGSTSIDRLYTYLKSGGRAAYEGLGWELLLGENKRS
jgi:hypothetical protein